MDFFKIVERSKRGELEIFPDFQTGKITDLLGRGKSFYAIWDEEKHLWSTDENDVQRIVDDEIWKYVEDAKTRRGYDGYLNVRTMKSNSSGMWNTYTQYMRRFPDSKIQLDNKLTFLNTEVKKKDYVSKRLPYSLEEGSYESWDKLVGTLYDPSEREKIEWAIGAIVSGDSRKIEKFFVFYGDPGKGKGTIIKIIQKLFGDYCIAFDAESLGSKSDQFSMEVFKSNPLVAVDPDGNLSRIESNTRLNKIVSHEEVVINEKGKSRYNASMNCFLFVGSNHTVKITDGKSGIIRRLIDISPSGKTFKPKEYEKLMSQIDFELGAIAWHCLQVYRELGKNYYKTYIPHQMIMKTDVFYNFVEANIDIFKSQTEGMGLTQAYALYKEYCEDSFMEYKLPRYKFREELKNYYKKFDELTRIDGKQVRSWYSGFLAEKFDPPVLTKEEKALPLVMDETESKLDILLADCPAQYAVDDGSGNEKPEMAWGDVTTTLKDLDTTKTHYVQTQKFNKALICVDFDKKNEKGEKDALLNAEAASKWIPTYSEYSKGGRGIHLHYIYDGDVNDLDPLYEVGVEIKVFRGKSALRMRLSKCNNIDIAHLPVGSLPIKEKKMIDTEKLKDEKHLRNLVLKAMRKEIKGCEYTRPAINFIKDTLDEAYESGLSYDLTELEIDLWQFAANSSNSSKYCLQQFNKMKLISEDRKTKKLEQKIIGSEEEATKKNEAPIAFYDIEVFQNLLLVCWKLAGEDEPVHRLFNPTPVELEELFKMNLIDFNGRKYDRIILYHRYLGNSIESCFDLSQRVIVEGARDIYSSEAISIGYTDVFDYCSKKQSLKKWEIEMANKWAKDHPGEKKNPYRHLELGFKWDEPVDPSLWNKVAEYCENDVRATEALHNYRQADFKGRLILSDISGGTPNDTTNQLSTRFIFAKDRNPQREFNYRNMGDMSDVSSIYDDEIARLGLDPEYTKFDSKGRPIFPNYKFENGTSTYRGEVVGEGGYVFAIPGIHTGIPTQDISGMHPASIIAEKLFGEKYTKRFEEIVHARTLIKHKQFDEAKKLLDGKLAKYLDDESQAKDLATALKIVVNSVYGLTSAHFSNPFKDPRNLDNIVAKRGALFMINLKNEVQRRGFTVVHCKTDSIKVENATEEIVQFIRDYGKLYGYSFETEAEYDRLCLVNNAVYIAYEKNEGWTAVGAQFQHPYVFKTLFTGEEITFDDLCETKSVTGGAIYLDLNEQLDNVSDGEEELARRIYNENHVKKQKLNPKFDSYTDGELKDYISKGHSYQFVGRVGSFVPVRSNSGGGLLVREKDGKYYAVTGTSGYRWLESEVVRELGYEKKVDMRYYESLADDAIAAIEQFGSYERFVDLSKPYEPEPKQDDTPWTIVPCGDGKYNTCMECPECKGDVCKRGYALAVNKE